MRDVIVSSRQTGKTTRMLIRAINAALDDEHVIVIAYSVDFISYLIQMASKILIATGIPHQFNKTDIILKKGGITFLSANKQGVDLQTGQVDGWVDSPIFVDHLALEKFIAKQAGWAWKEWIKS